VGFLHITWPTDAFDFLLIKASEKGYRVFLFVVELHFIFLWISFDSHQ
jgi:hypothetical protein